MTSPTDIPVSSADEIASLRARLAEAEEGDPTWLQEVFWNLLNNAAKFTPTGGRIDIASAESDLNRVRDNGADIDAAHLPALFAALEKSGLTPTQRFGGLGLGLAICRGVINLHGGQIWAESDGVDKGATFLADLVAENSG